LPEYYKYKVVPSLIEITLVKEVSGRWGALEAPVRKGNLYNKQIIMYCYISITLEYL